MDDAMDLRVMPRRAVDAFVVQRGGAWELVDGRGESIGGNRFARAARATEGRAVIGVAQMRSLMQRLAGREQNLSWGYADAAGQMVIAPQFRACGYFSEGLAPVKAGDNVPEQCRPGNAGFIDRDGIWIIPPRYGDARQFSEGLAPVYMGPTRMWGFMNRDHKFVILPKFREACPFSEGLAAVDAGGVGGDARGTWGFVDKAGEWVLRPSFDRALSFGEGLAPATPGPRDPAFAGRRGQWGYMTPAGEWAVEPQYVSAYSFSEGLGLVCGSEGWRFIRNDGHTAFAVSGEYIPYPFSGGLAPVARAAEPERIWGYLDAAGAVAFSAE